MTEWKVQLEGAAQDLEELAKASSGCPVDIRRHTEFGFVLEADVFENEDDNRAVREKAQRIVETLNGAARLWLQSKTQITLGFVARQGSDSVGAIYVTPEPAAAHPRAPLGTVVMRGPDGTEEVIHSATPAMAWVLKAQRDERVARALRLRGKEDLDWVGLCRVLDVIEEAAAGASGVVSAGWANENELERLRHTANSLRAAGDSARHGRERFAPPERPMELSQARALVDRVLRLWIDSVDAV